MEIHIKCIFIVKCLTHTYFYCITFILWKPIFTYLCIIVLNVLILKWDRTGVKKLSIFVSVWNDAFKIFSWSHFNNKIWYLLQNKIFEFYWTYRIIVWPDLQRVYSMDSIVLIISSNIGFFLCKVNGFHSPQHNTLDCWQRYVCTLTFWFCPMSLQKKKKIKN